MAAKRFKEGDLVFLKKDLCENQLYGGFYCTRRMLDETEGKLLKIELVDDKSYKVDLSSSPFFTDEMLEPACDCLADLFKGVHSDLSYKKHIDAPFKLKIKTKRIKFNFNN